MKILSYLPHLLQFPNSDHAQTPFTIRNKRWVLGDRGVMR